MARTSFSTTMLGFSLLLVSHATGEGVAAPGRSPESESGFAQRYPRYRLQPSDVLELQYRYTPEYNQTVGVQPDGFVSLNLIGDVRLSGLTMEEARAVMREKSSARLRDPEITLILKEYERPHFFVTGEVATPGRYDMRGSVSTMEALAMAGGLKASAKHSQAILYRRIDPETAETRSLDLRKIATLAGGSEDIQLRPGDLLFIPQSRISKVERFVKWGSFGVFLNPLSR